jgi:hypothetical protein
MQEVSGSIPLTSTKMQDAQNVLQASRTDFCPLRLEA